jgi:alginate O-acetyltransferase complex protein AlgJ
MRRLPDILLIAMLAVTAIIFGVGTFTGQQSVSISEKRTLAELPKLRRKTISTFPTGFENFFNDHLFKRTEMVALRNFAKYSVWGTSGNDDVIVGKAGWLYLASEGSVGIARHEQLFTQQELEHWRDVLYQRKNWLAAKGIKYLFVVAPDKPSIYPEYMPPKLSPVHSQSKLDQLTAYLRHYPDIPFVSLADPLRAQKDMGTLYLKTDSHWNQLGAYLGYKTVIDAARHAYPSLITVPAAAALFAQRTFAGGDCACMIGLGSLLSEKVPQMAKLLNAPKPERLPKALVFHDSFGDALNPYLKNQFPEIVTVKQADLYCDATEIARAKPDIVIQECVERHVSRIHPAFVQDWAQWLADSLPKQMGSKQYLMLLPNTDDVNAARVGKYLRDFPNIEATNCREWNDAGEAVSFNETKAQYPGFYLLKTGDQGAKLIDERSEIAYKKLQAFIEDGKHYRLLSELPLVDGTKLQLYGRR